MDAEHFDALLRALATDRSRRTVLGLLSGLGLTGLLGPAAEAGKHKKKKKKVTVCLNGQTLRVSKSVALVLVSQGATLGACPPVSPPVPPPPPGPPPPPPPICTSQGDCGGPVRCDDGTGNTCICSVRRDNGQPVCVGVFVVVPDCGECDPGEICVSATCGANIACTSACPNPR